MCDCLEECIKSRVSLVLLLILVHSLLKRILYPSSVIAFLRVRYSFEKKYFHQAITRRNSVFFPSVSQQKTERREWAREDTPLEYWRRKKKEEREKKEIWTRRTPVVTSLPTPERPTHITRNGTKRSSVKYQILVGNHLTDRLLLCASTAFKFKQNLYSGIELRIRYSNLSWYYIIPDIWD